MVLGAGFDAGSETGIAAALDIGTIVTSAGALMYEAAVLVAELVLPDLRPVHGNEIAREELETKQKAEAEEEAGAVIESQEQDEADDSAQEMKPRSAADDEK